MSGDGFISINRPGTSDQNSTREWPRTRRKGQRSCKRRFSIIGCKRYFFFLVWVRLRWILRPTQFQNLIGTFEIQLFVISVLAPVSGDLVFCCAQSSKIFRPERRKFESHFASPLGYFRRWNPLNSKVPALHREAERDTTGSFNRQPLLHTWIGA